MKMEKIKNKRILYIITGIVILVAVIIIISVIINGKSGSGISLLDASKAKEMTLEEYCDRFNEIVVAEHNTMGQNRAVTEAAQQDAGNYQYFEDNNPEMILGETLTIPESGEYDVDTSKYDIYMYRTTYTLSDIGSVEIDVLTEKDSENIKAVTAVFDAKDFSIGDSIVQVVAPSFGEEPDDFHTMYYELRDTWNSHRYMDGVAIELSYENSNVFLRMYFEDESYYEKEWVNNPDIPTQDNPKDYKELIGTWETESEYYEQSSLVIYDIDENEMRFSLYNYTENGDCVDNVTLDISEKQYTEWEPNRKFAVCDNNGKEIGTFIIPSNSTGVADTITFQTGSWTAVYEKVSDDTNEENTNQYDEAVGDWEYTKYAEDMPGGIVDSKVTVHIYYVKNNLITFDVSKYIWEKDISIHTNIITALLKNGVAKFSFSNEYGNEGTGNIKLGTESIKVELVTTVEAEEEALSMDLRQTLTRTSAIDSSQDNNENGYENTVDTTDDYIFPESSDVYLDESALYNYTPDELMLGRNEIYARHGRIFDDPEIQAYFESKSWYEGTITGDEFDSQVDLIFNEYEKENVETIRQVEEMMRQGII